MGNVARVAAGDLGGGISDVHAYSKGMLTFYIARFTMSGSYATGGDTIVVPFSKTKSLKVRQVIVTTPWGLTLNAGRLYGWNGSRTTPKIQAIVSSTGAEVANATDLSAVTVEAIIILEG